MRGTLLLVCVSAACVEALVPTRALPRVVVQRQTTVVSMKLYDWKRREADESHLIRFDSQEFRVDNIRGAPGSKKRRTRKGRGNAAGQGSSCGFGMRGQKSRSGRPQRPGFEGGQTPLYRRLPKLVGRPTGPGHQHTTYGLIRLDELAALPDSYDVSYESLTKDGYTTKNKHRKVVKVVGGKEPPATFPKNLTVKAHAFSKSARDAIEANGGTCLLLHKNTNVVLPSEPAA